MIIEHVAIWTYHLEKLKEFYTKYFKARCNEKYINEKKGFESYFLSFESGARLELMSRGNIPPNQNDTINAQHTGIIHLAFGLPSIDEVDQMALQFRNDGITILSGPRKTGDGYYEFETLDPDDNRIEITTKYES